MNFLLTADLDRFCIIIASNLGVVNISLLFNSILPFGSITVFRVVFIPFDFI